MKNTTLVYDAKRLIGRKYSDHVVQTDKKGWMFEVVKSDGSDDKPLIQVKFDGAPPKLYQTEQISAFILAYLKEQAEKFVGYNVSAVDTIITVPAYFNDS